MILKKSLGVFLFGAALSATRLPAQSAATVTIQAGQPGAVVSSNLFGIFFEEINFAGEGGLLPFFLEGDDLGAFGALVLTVLAVLGGGVRNSCHEQGSHHNNEHPHWQPAQHGRTGC